MDDRKQSSVQTDGRMKRNDGMTRKYHLSIYDSLNARFPFFVEEWGFCVTDQELANGEIEPGTEDPATMSGDPFDNLYLNRGLTEKYGLDIYDTLLEDRPYDVPRFGIRCVSEGQIAFLAGHGMCYDADLSDRFCGITVLDTDDRENPYYVPDWDAFCDSVETIETLYRDWMMIQSCSQDDFEPVTK